MSDAAILMLLYGVGVLVLVSEIFIPSHGVLSVTGIGFLIAAVVKTFDVGGRDAGIIAVFACLVFVPVFAFVAIKYWHLTPMGKRIAPPNPIATVADTSIPVNELSRLIGQTGRSVTPLRPAGICDFGGKRISCVAEYGLIEAGVTVEALRISGSNLAVQASEQNRPASGKG
ncbi:MAG: NfeD family protein [Phycisphaerae bacterium]|jgi:membrane-bound serine protease (ClpP class)